jgi:hypothetical protein
MAKTFEEWYREVDLEVSALIGLGRDDLPDYCYRDAFDDGRSPRQAAKAAIRNAGDF